MHKPKFIARLAAISLGGCLAAGVLQATEVVFVDGGYAELCSMAAYKLDEYQRITITGSRLGLSPIEVCTRAVNGMEPESVNVAGSYNNRGVLWFEKGDYDRALADFMEAIALDNKLAQAHVNRGYTLTVLKEWEQSIEAYTQGIALGTSELAKAYYNRGVAYEELGQLGRAYQDYRQASITDPLWEVPRQELSRFNVPSP